MAYLEITMKVDEANRAAAADVYQQYKQPFLDTINGAQDKELLVRADDVQVLHRFSDAEAAQAYLSSELFTQEVFASLSPLVSAEPEVRVYETA